MRSSKQQELEEFVLDSLLPKLEEAIKLSLRNQLPSAKVFTLGIGGDSGKPGAKVGIAVTFEGNFDLSNLKLKGGRSESLLN